ncbi:MAG: hypothetical protein H0W02_18000 [Ktedonobacteraceae bacterium]|nr:hypothetical protein [Ktedonobacteraceae bacterium]
MTTVLKYLKMGPHGIGALGIILGASLLRLVLIAQGWPALDSDEGTMGLMALHIAYHGEHPSFFYGQNYMGTFEAFLGATMFHLAGPSLFTLRIGLVLLFALFLLSMYLLVRLLYTKNFALASLILLALGSSPVVKRELTAIGGYAETLFLGALALFLAAWLAHSWRRDLPSSARRWRLLIYSMWGFVAGFGLWSDLLIFPFICMSALLLLLFCRAELKIWAIGCLSLGLMIGAFPLIVYNVSSPADNSLRALWYIHHGGPAGEALRQLPAQQQVAGTLLIALPLATNVSPICTPLDPFLLERWQPPTWQCDLYQGSWGVGFLLLGGLAIVLAARPAWRLWREHHRSPKPVWPDDERQALIRDCARLAVLGSGGLTLLFYIISPVAALSPQTSYRYLLGLLIAMPAVTWPLWRSATAASLSMANKVKRQAPPALNRALIALIALAFIGGMIGTFEDARATQAMNQRQEDLIQQLVHLHVRYIYSEYWTCDRLMFQSQEQGKEQIYCAVLDDGLLPGFDRYPPYRSIVVAHAFPTYVFPLDSRGARAFARFVIHRQGQYLRFVFDGYVVYLRRPK